MDNMIHRDTQQTGQSKSGAYALSGGMDRFRAMASPKNQKIVGGLLAALAVVSLGFFIRSRREYAAGKALDGGMKIGPDGRSRDLDRKFGDDRRKRDVVEEASWESFPASDPPAY